MSAPDLLIAGGRICDGTGSPWFRGDVAVSGDRIVAVGAAPGRARRTIRADGLVVCPGFVDIHTHTDEIVERPAAENVLRQGVTTVVSGNCGTSALPVGRLLDRVEAARPAVNFGTLVGHGEVRRSAMGLAGRRPSRREQAAMSRAAEAAMKEGALGISTGLFYVPGAYAQLAEIVATARPVAAAGGIYASHIRSSGGRLFEALEEAAAVGRRARIPVQVSHLKLFHRRGRTSADRAERVLAAIARHREAGVDLTFDAYPYAASNTELSAVVLPAWVSAGGGRDARLGDPAVRRRIAAEVAGNIAWMGGPGRIVIAAHEAEPALEGRSLAEVARRRRRTAAATALDLVAEGDPRCIFHGMRQADVDRIVCAEPGMIASDGRVDTGEASVVHPRLYGTFPRVLREQVREKRLLGLEQAIRKMTSLPAARVGLRDRGRVAPGMKADLLVLDPARVSDRATFADSRAFPVGFRAILVNGNPAWHDGRLSPRRAGAVLRRR